MTELMERSVKLATPTAAERVKVPLKVPAGEPPHNAMVMGAVEEVSVAPLAYWTATETVGIVAPLLTLVGG